MDVLVEVKGMGSGPSPPTIPPAKALATTLVLFVVETGAKAEAEAAARRRTVVLRVIVARHKQRKSN